MGGLCSYPYFLRCEWSYLMYWLSLMAARFLTFPKMFASSLYVERLCSVSSFLPCCLMVAQTSPLELHSSRAGLKLGRLGLGTHMGRALFQMPHTHNIWLLFPFLHSCLSGPQENTNSVTWSYFRSSFTA